MTAILPFPVITSAERVRGLLSAFTRKLPQPSTADIEQEVKHRLLAYPQWVQQRAARWAVQNTGVSAESAIRSAVLRAESEFEPLPPSAA